MMTKFLRTRGVRIVLILSVFIIIAGVFFQNPMLASSSPLDTGVLGIKVIDAAKPLLLDETAATYASDCVTPKTDFALGETVCGKISNTQLGTPPQRRFEFANPGNYVVQIGPDVTTDPQTSSFSLPSTQTSIVGGSILVDNRGTWRFASVDSGAEGRAVAYFTVHDPIADLTITKTDGTATAVPGTSVTYTIVASNAGPDTATGAIVTDVFSAGFYTSDTWTCVGAGGGSCPASGSGNINAPVNLPAGGTATFTVIAHISPGAVGTLSNTATIALAPGPVIDPNLGNNTATDTDTLIPTAEVSVTKTDGVTTVTAGGNDVYTIVASNAGPSNTFATVTDTFPAIFTGATWTCSQLGGASCGAFAGSGNINNLVSLPVGSSVTYVVTGTIAAGSTGNLSNTATAAVFVGVTDPNPANNSATDTDQIVVSISGNIQRFVPGGPNTNLPGVTVNYTGTTTGSTTTDASGNYTLANLPSGGSFVVTPTSGVRVFEPIMRTINNLTTNVSNANFIAYDNQAAVPRVLTVVNSFVSPGQNVSVPIDLNSLGNEASLQFSLSYDPNRLDNPTVVCGSSATGCNTTMTNPSPGVLGITITPVAPFGAGPREIVKVNFLSFATSAQNAPINFTGTPTVQLVKNASGDPLPANYVNGLVIFAQGLEGDVACASACNSGDGQLLSNDVVKVRQMVVGTVIPDPTVNEFQRADSAPRGSLGDGSIDSADVTQVRRYVAGLDPTQPAGGPGGPPQPVLARPVEAETAKVLDTKGRALRISSVPASPGAKTTISIEMNGTANESAASFTLVFDASKLSNPQVSLGSGAPPVAVLTTNLKTAASGKIGILVDSTEAFVGSQLVTITFDVAQDASGGETPLTFTNSLAPRSTSDSEGNPLDTKYVNGSLTISGPASAGYEISGRVLLSNGQGLRNASVTLTDANGNVRTAVSSTFGYYTFAGVARDQTYTIAVESKRYRFASQTLHLTDNLVDVDIIAQE